MMERYLGLDIGDKFIGVAVSDPLGLTAQGITTIKRVNRKYDYEEIFKYIQEYDVKKIIVGLPKNMNNTLGPQGEKVITFAERLNKKYGVELIYVDERLSTVAAEKVLIGGSVRRENRKKYIDKIAASYILQNYLNSMER